MQVNSQVVRTYKDIDFNFTKTGTKDILVLTQENAVRQSLRNLILTNYQERPFQPYLGCNITRNLFENGHPALALELRNSIQETIENNEPRVNLINTKVALSDHKITVEIIVRIVNVPNEITVDIDLERLR